MEKAIGTPVRGTLGVDRYSPICVCVPSRHPSLRRVNTDISIYLLSLGVAGSGKFARSIRVCLPLSKVVTYGNRMHEVAVPHPLVLPP